MGSESQGHGRNRSKLQPAWDLRRDWRLPSFRLMIAGELAGAGVVWVGIFLGIFGHPALAIEIVGGGVSITAASPIIYLRVWRRFHPDAARVRQAGLSESNQNGRQ